MAETKRFFSRVITHTLQGINISHLGKRKNHLQNAIFGGYVSSLEGNPYAVELFFPLFTAGVFVGTHLLHRPSGSLRMKASMASGEIRLLSNSKPLYSVVTSQSTKWAGRCPPAELPEVGSNEITTTGVFMRFAGEKKAVVHQPWRTQWKNLSESLSSIQGPLFSPSWNTLFSPSLGVSALMRKKKRTYIWGFPKMVGFPNNHGVFLLKMISTWGNIGGTTILRKQPSCTSIFWRLQTSDALKTLENICAGKNLQSTLPPKPAISNPVGFKK